MENQRAGCFFSTIYKKDNIAEQLERQLASPSWKGEVINLGGVTDNYQPWEAENGMMKEVLEVLIKYRNPCIISTKSDLILRDYELIDRLSRLTYVNIASTITCVDEDLAASGYIRSRYPSFPFLTIRLKSVILPKLLVFHAPSKRSCSSSLRRATRSPS